MKDYKLKNTTGTDKDDFSKMRDLLEDILNCLNSYRKVKNELSGKYDYTYNELLNNILEQNIVSLFKLLEKSKDLADYLKKVIVSKGKLPDNCLKYIEFDFSVSSESVGFFQAVKNKIHSCIRDFNYVSEKNKLSKSSKVELKKYCKKKANAWELHNIEVLFFGNNYSSTTESACSRKSNRRNNEIDFSKEVDYEVFIKGICIFLRLNDRYEYENLKNGKYFSTKNKRNNIPYNSKNDYENQITDEALTAEMKNQYPSLFHDEDTSFVLVEKKKKRFHNNKVEKLSNKSVNISRSSSSSSYKKRDNLNSNLKGNHKNYSSYSTCRKECKEKNSSIFKCREKLSNMIKENKKNRKEDTNIPNPIINEKNDNKCNLKKIAKTEIHTINNVVLKKTGYSVHNHEEKQSGTPLKKSRKRKNEEINISTSTFNERKKVNINSNSNSENVEINMVDIVKCKNRDYSSPKYMGLSTKNMKKSKKEINEKEIKNNLVSKEKCKVDFNVKNNFQNSNTYSMKEEDLKKFGSPSSPFEETPPKFLMKNRNEKKESLSKNNTDGKEKCKVDFNVKSNFQISNVYSMNEKELKENGSPAPLFEETPPKFLMKNRNEKKEPLSKNNTDGKEKCKIDFNVKSNFQISNVYSMNEKELKENGSPAPLFEETPPKFLMKNRNEKKEPLSKNN
ncbi:conserved Plasmodium protein, unknown function, partial [Plasmodium relictum]